MGLCNLIVIVGVTFSVMQTAEGNKYMNVSIDTRTFALQFVINSRKKECYSSEETTHLNDLLYCLF